MSDALEEAVCIGTAAVHGAVEGGVLADATERGFRERLIDVSRVHVDGCIYTGPGCLRFARQLRDWGGRVVVPTTLNAISVDYQGCA